MRVAERFAAVTGEWTGVNNLRMMPDDEFRGSDGSATIATQSRGNIATIAYTWSDFDGQPQAGLLVLSDGEGEGEVSAIWSDSWHQHPQWLPMTGSVSAGGVISVRGIYGAGDEQGSWWIHLDPTDAARLTMTMDNEWMDSGQYEVVRATFARGSAGDATV